MTSLNDGGQAFPSRDRSIETISGEQAIFEDNVGMSIRDWFASRAPREITNWYKDADAKTIGGDLGISADEYAKDYAGNYMKALSIRVYQWADAMIAEKDRQK